MRRKDHWRRLSWSTARHCIWCGKRHQGSMNINYDRRHPNCSLRSVLMNTFPSNKYAITFLEMFFGYFKRITFRFQNAVDLFVIVIALLNSLLLSISENYLYQGLTVTIKVILAWMYQIIHCFLSPGPCLLFKIAVGRIAWPMLN